MSVTSSGPSPVSLPRHRGCPFDPPGAYGALRARRRAARLAFSDGKTGWLLTGYDDVRDLLADDRFSSDRVRASSPVRAFPVREDDERRLGSFIGMDPPEHTRYRRLLTGSRSGGRGLAPRVERIVADHLDAMADMTAPADLVRAFAPARPVPGDL